VVERDWMGKWPEKVGEGGAYFNEVKMGFNEKGREKKAHKVSVCWTKARERGGKGSKSGWRGGWVLEGKK